MMRVHKTKDYIVMSNHAIKNEKLSWKGKGLLAYLLSLPDDWKIYLEELTNHAKDGRDGTAAGIKELIKEGYIVRTQIKNPNGKFGEYVYEVYEIPCTDSGNNPEKKNFKNSQEKHSETPDNSDIQPKTDFPNTVLPKAENPELLSINNTKYKNNYKDSMSLSNQKDIQREDLDNDTEVSLFVDKTIETVKQNIKLKDIEDAEYRIINGFPKLATFENTYGDNLAISVTTVLLNWMDNLREKEYDFVSSGKKTVNGKSTYVKEKYTRKRIFDILLELRVEHIQFICNQFSNQKGNIRNKSEYLKTMIFNVLQDFEAGIRNDLATRREEVE